MKKSADGNNTKEWEGARKKEEPCQGVAELGAHCGGGARGWQKTGMPARADEALKRRIRKKNRKKVFVFLDISLALYSF